jgi:hypothetical protein
MYTICLVLLIVWRIYFIIRHNIFRVEDIIKQTLPLSIIYTQCKVQIFKSQRVRVPGSQKGEKTFNFFKQPNVYK